MAMPRHPDARRYYRAGQQRFNEAKLILRRVQLPAAAVYLSGYAVECLLKALLIERTPEVDRPTIMESMKTEFGHNLTRLRLGLVRRGVRIPPNIVGELNFVARWSPEMRYDPGPGSMVAGNRFLTAAERTVKWADGSM